MTSRLHQSIRPAPSAAASRGQVAPLPSLDELGLPPLHAVAGYRGFRGEAYPTDSRSAAAVEAAAPDDEEAQAALSSPDESEDASGDLDPSPGPGPPTKRKTQNRVAQRAFRKRRAARVSELEKELEEQQAMHKEGDAAMAGQINDLELEIESFKAKCKLLEDMLERERNERLRAEMEAQAVRLSRSRGTSQQLGSGNEASQENRRRGDSEIKTGRSSASSASPGRELSTMEMGNSQDHHMEPADAEEETTDN